MTGRTIVCPDCGLTWTCPDFCYPGSHAIDDHASGPEYCRRCGNIRAGIPYTKDEIAQLKNWHEEVKPVQAEKVYQMDLFPAA